MIVTGLVFAWATAWAVRSILRMRKGDYSVVHPVLLVIYVFLAMPLIYEIVWGLPDYTRFPGFEIAQSDPLTQALYLLYVALMFPILYVAAKYGVPQNISLEPRREPFRLPEILRITSFISLMSPILLLFFAPAPEVYFDYAVSQGDNFTEEVADFHALIAVSGRLAIIAAVALILSAKKVTPGLFITIMIALAASSWLTGKRSEIAIILLGLIFAFWQRGLLHGKRLILAGLAAIFGLILFSVAYQEVLRSHLEIASTYEGFRLDYTRDVSVKLAIYSVLNPTHIQVIEKGQTLSLYAGQLIPRDWWPDKPYPYAQYLISAAFLQPPQLWGWGFTTSWFGEWVSNVGLAAFGVAPALLGLLCRLADGLQIALAKAVVTVVLVLLIVLHVAAFSVLIPIAAAFCLWDWMLAKKIRDREKVRLIPRISSRIKN